MGSQCRCQIHRLYLRQELFTHVYMHMDIFMKSYFSKHDHRTWHLYCKHHIWSVLIAFGKQALHIFTEYFQRLNTGRAAT